MTEITVILIIVAIFAIIFVFSGLKVVQQSQTMVIERLGRYNRTLNSGINIIWPIIDKPREISWRYIVENYEGRKTG